MLKTEWLYYFITLAETGNFKQAAAKLNITQQALSKNLGNLEKQLGMRLIERQRRFQHLTSAGELFLQQARGSLHQLENIVQNLQDHQTQVPNGELKIGWVNAWGYHLLPHFLRAYLTKYPDVFPLVYGMSTPYIEQFLVDGRLDIGLTISQPRQLELTSWERPESIAYLIVSAPQVGKKPQKQAWQQLKYITWETVNPLREYPVLWNDTRYPRQIVAKANSFSGIIQLCLAGLGAAYVPEPVVRAELESGLLYEAAQAPFEHYLKLHVVSHANRYQSAATRAFLEMLKS